MPSPESPANLMTTRCFSSTCLVIVRRAWPGVPPSWHRKDYLDT
jgi:hypothetical protein